MVCIIYNQQDDLGVSETQGFTPIQLDDSVVGTLHPPGKIDMAMENDPFTDLADGSITRGYNNWLVV